MAESVRVDEPTPNGGEYSEMVFFNEQDEIVDESEATRCVIRECMSDGTLVAETWGVV